jgi:tetratricopeptide (TPR) repeat protein
MIAAVLAAGAVRGVQMITRPSLCHSGESKLAGIWDQSVKAQVRKAFLGTGQSFAADTFWSVNRLFEDYVQRWVGTYTEACEATHSRGEQSAEVLDLRMSCLQDRLGGLKALTAVFVQADAPVVENAANAASQLAGLERCNDVKLLRSVVPPPENPVARRQVDELRVRVAEARALLASGRLTEAEKATAFLVQEARRVEYAPLLAEALELRGRVQVDLYKAADAEKTLEEGIWTAEEARHDEVKAEIAVDLISVMSMRVRPEDTERWWHMSEATLRRIGGHERLQVWMNTNLGGALEESGQPNEALARHQLALAIGERALRPDDPDLMRIHGNISNALIGLNRPGEALVHSDRAIEIGRKAVGADHPQLALQFSNRGEILNQLGRWEEARASCLQAIALWEKQLGKEHPFLGYALYAIGLAYLGEGKPALAVAPLERALRIRVSKEPSPAHIAETEFALARALWESGQQRDRARTLALSAQGRYSTVATLRKQEAEVVAWLAKHTPPAVSAR